jgi:adenine-specific DNA-methyltransferase
MRECDDIVMDFFSGSATTAHAMLLNNMKYKRHNKFIMIQWPEETSVDSEAYKAGYKNICEIGKERIRRAGKKILEEQKAKQGDLFSDDQKPLDVGFRVFKCADSNMKDVYYTPADYSQQLLLELEDNIKDDRNDLDLLFGCMLDWGVTLDLPMRTEKVDSVTIHIVNDGDLVACFDHNIPETAIDYIASLLPMRVVLRDSCFCEAKEKMNFFEIFKQRTGWSEEEVRKNVKVI